MNELKCRRELIEVCRLAYKRGYICGTEGNFSLRLDDGRVLSTPRGTCKARIDPEDLVITDGGGQVVPTNAQAKRAQPRLPSTELPMHLAAYKARPDARAVAHAHPTATVAFSVAGRSLSKCILPEVVCTLGVIPVAPYATPSTAEVPASIEGLIKDHDAVVLDHHGVLTVGEDIWDAFYKLETLEHHAQTMLIAELLGGAKLLTSSQVKKLLDIRGVYGLTRPLPVNILTSPDCSEPDPEKGT